MDAAVAIHIPLLELGWNGTFVGKLLDSTVSDGIIEQSLLVMFRQRCLQLAGTFMGSLTTSSSDYILLPCGPNLYKPTHVF
jgi:hypothetical protein